MFHAIGDLGVRKALDAVELPLPSMVKMTLGIIFASSIADPADRARFEALNVTPTCSRFGPCQTLTSPTLIFQWLATPVNRCTHLVPLPGQARAYCRQHWSVSSMNPFLAIKRRSLAGRYGSNRGRIEPAEAISLAEAACAHTATAPT